jgi:hypothetical protein
MRLLQQLGQPCWVHLLLLLLMAMVAEKGCLVLLAAAAAAECCWGCCQRLLQSRGSQSCSGSNARSTLRHFSR